jgi:uncharacterized membrane protein
MALKSMSKTPWIVFALALLFAVAFFSSTAPHLPALVASHFDGTGYPTAHMSREFYIKFVFIMGVGFPIAMVTLLTAIYSRANDMKLPNRDYWLAPERIAQTRALLVSHVVWFGTLMVAMVCYVHWLELAAHRSAPPHLSNRLVGVGLLVFFAVTGVWIIKLLRAFRSPPIIT